jgi:hypothetical protein
MKSLSITRLLSSVLLSILLAACGGGGGGASNTAVPVAAATTPMPTPAPSPLPYAIPGNLWSAPSSAMPASGNYVYLQSDPGDFIGAGKTYQYTSANALINTTSNGLAFNVNVHGDERWAGTFLLPSGAGNLQAGYFAGLASTTFADKAVGGIDWSGEGRSCDARDSWLVIDKITVTGSAITALDMRFEQRCNTNAVLHGQGHWTQANQDSAVPPRPSAIPSTLWQPAAPIVSAGSYLYVENHLGDYPGSGQTFFYTQANSILKTTLSGAHLHMSVAGDANLTGDFVGMLGMSQLTVGYYPNLKGYPVNNPVLGGIDWSGGGGCNTETGWFAVDKVSYNGTALAAIDLRFEQYCEDNKTPTHGQLHWVANDTTTPPGPMDPPPAGLWAPDALFVAPVGNYFYVASEPGDNVGMGKTQLFTTNDTTIVGTPDLQAGFQIKAGSYNGQFYAMNTLSQLQPGFYGGLERYPFNNPVKGGLSVTGGGTACNTVRGWFVVDKAVYSMAQLTAIDLRFEQRCENNAGVLHGQIHWVKP